MKVHRLKILRVAFSLLFFIITSLLFLDFRRIIPDSWFNVLLSLQFVPSLLKFSTVLSLSVFGFVVVLLFTFLFGRIYCSTICPLGILQDVTAWISRKMRSRKKRRYHHAPAHNLLRYGILGITLAALVFGSTWLLLLLDPYSNYGRIMTYFLKPVVVGINNVLASLLEKKDIYVLYPVSIPAVKAAVYAVPAVILVLTLWMSATRGRLYCNTVCPVGAFLGLISKVSLFRFRLNRTACTSCQLCVFSCKSSCIDLKEMTIDDSRCVTCFNCLDACNFGAIIFTARRPLAEKNAPKLSPVTVGKKDDYDPSKRAFVVGAMAFFAGISGISLAKEYPKNAKPTTIPEEKKFPVVPPGSISIKHFTDH